MVETSTVRVTPRVLFRYIQKQFHISTRQARTWLTCLVEKGELCYRQEFGTTFVDLNFSKPVPLTEHFTVSPPLPKSVDKKTLTICLEPGISFGSGRHPTTRLCLDAIDRLVFHDRVLPVSCERAADIGTGSGILAIALCLATSVHCTAYEIDPVCRFQAERNIALNRLSHRIEIRDDTIGDAMFRFSIIVANLRLPSLKQMSGAINSALETNGFLILSGIRPDELKPLVLHYSQYHMKPVSHADEKDWSCVTMVRSKS